MRSLNRLRPSAKVKATTLRGSTPGWLRIRATAPRYYLRLAQAGAGDDLQGLVRHATASCWAAV